MLLTQDDPASCVTPIGSVIESRCVSVSRRRKPLFWRAGETLGGVGRRHWSMIGNGAVVYECIAEYL